MRDDLKHPRIDVGSDCRVPPTPEETIKYREHVGRVERAKTGTHAATATVAAVRHTPATAVCTVASAATMLCSQDGCEIKKDCEKREGKAEEQNFLERA